MSNKMKDITGKQYTRLTVVKYIGKKKKLYIWECICECGNMKNVPRTDLTSGHVRSCGCLQKDLLAQRSFKKRTKFEPSKVGQNDVLSQYERSAKKRNLDWNLTEEQAIELFKDNCYYCDTEPNTNRQRKSFYEPFFFNGIDRIDNSEGYLLNNVRSCCKICNMMKSNLTEKEFYEHIFKICGNMNKKGRSNDG
jgi:hypothetical protein